MRLALLMLAAAALLVPVAAPATQIIVDVNQGGDHETIQDGIDAASNGDTVLVYPGTYTGEGNRDIEFGTKNLVLRSTGGRDVTIIDPGYGVHRCMDFKRTGQDTTCVIDGFTLQGGHLQDLYVGGAGVRIDATVGTGTGPASPKFMNCIIRDNYNSRGPGGAVYLNGDTISPGPSPIFESVIFEGNYAYTGGGGVYATWRSDARFSNCVFSENENAVWGYGGGLTCKFQSNARLTSCIFEENLSTYGAGLSCTDGANPTLTNCTFIGNSVGGGGDGGALYCSEASVPTLRNCTFYANRVIGEGEGECVYADDNSHPVLLQCLFVRSGFAPSGGASGEGPEARTSSFYCSGGATLDVGQSCSYGNAYGDDMCGTVVCGSGFLICENPLFCDPSQGDLSLAQASPCLPAGNVWGVRIGAHGQGCSHPAVEQTSWGAIKGLYH